MACCVSANTAPFPCASQAAVPLCLGQLRPQGLSHEAAAWCHHPQPFGDRVWTALVASAHVRDSSLPMQMSSLPANPCQWSKPLGLPSMSMTKVQEKSRAEDRGPWGLWLAGPELSAAPPSLFSAPTLTPASVLLLQEVLGSFLKGLSEFQTRDFSIHHFNPFHVMAMLINYQFPGSCSARSLCPGHSRNTSGARAEGMPRRTRCLFSGILGRTCASEGWLGFSSGETEAQRM